MTEEKEKKFIEYLKIVSPGSPLRNVINDLARSNLGAMIVFDSPTLRTQNLTDGGFKINCRFTPQKLFELCKMDGAIILSQDLKRILYANVLMTPETSINTSETGTRHKAAERVAKQANTFVIAVSERKNKTTIYHDHTKYFIKSSDELLRDTNTAITILEKQTENLKECSTNLNILEMSELVSVSDVCKVIQRAEMILKISKSVKRNFTELGNEGNILNMRYKELIRGVEKAEEEVLRDYATLPLKKSKNLLANITFEGLLDLESIARLTLEENLEENISPKGFRFLAHLNITKKEISLLVQQFQNLNNILKSDSRDLEKILKNRASSINEEITNLREQILSGKVIY
ncbi:MAG: DNA integrity scanning diadenylate cyclase DisA [archaeon]